MTFIRPAHQIIADVLSRMDHTRLMDSQCWFGGGTAIVLKLGEYRQSLDVDFLCSDRAGYRELRNALVSNGPQALFSKDVTVVRETRADQYGIRMHLDYKGQPIKFEIVRESRISVDGQMDTTLKVPTLSTLDMFAEKLLANADRCMDRHVAYRDAIDLGMLVKANSGIPAAALAKAVEAYGADIERKTLWIVNHLLQTDELRHAADVLQMDEAIAADAIAALRQESLRIWPHAETGKILVDQGDHKRD
jgi:hypothetical protein